MRIVYGTSATLEDKRTNIQLFRHVTDVGTVVSPEGSSLGFAFNLRDFNDTHVEFYKLNRQGSDVSTQTTEEDFVTATRSFSPSIFSNVHEPLVLPIKDMELN